MDNTVTVIKNTISATPIDKDRLVVGTEDGLFCVDLERDGKRAGDVSELILTSINFRNISRGRREKDLSGGVLTGGAADHSSCWATQTDETDTNPSSGPDRDRVDQGRGHQELHR